MAGKRMAWVFALLAGCGSLSLPWGRESVGSVASGSLAGGIRVEWRPVSGASAYRVYVRTDPDVDPGTGEMLETTATSMDVRGLPAVPHFAVVTALRSGVESDASAAVSAIPLAGGWSGAVPSTTPAWSITGASGSDFGSALAAGDVDQDGFSDVVVGADEAGAGNEGEVQLFTGGTAGLATTATWTLPGLQAAGEFGDSLAVGDVDGDGSLEVAVGARDHDLGQSGEGALYLFDGPQPVPTSPKVTVESDQASAGLCTDVIGVGDFDGDGLADFAAPAPLHDGGAVDTGAVVVVYGGAGTFEVVSLDGTHPDGRFGSSLAVGDLDGDGYDDLAVGSTLWEPGGGDDLGRVEVFHGGAGGLSVSSISISGAGTNAFFGSASTAADVDGDGRDELIVAGWGVNGSAGFDTGRAYLVHETAGALALGTWTFDPDDAGARLGDDGSDAARVDVNGDGFDDVVLAAPRYDRSAGTPRAGAAFLFLGSQAGLDSTPAWSYVGTTSSADSMVVSSAGDVDGNGSEEVIVAWPSKRVARLFAGPAAFGPLPDAGDPMTAIAGQPASPSGAGFTGTAGSAHVCTWSFDDGTPDLVIDPCLPATAGGVSHTWTAPGRYRMRLHITDAAGIEGEGVVFVDVQ